MTHSLFSRFLGIIALLKRKILTASIRYRAWKLNPSRLILNSIKHIHSPVFVQIGSNDGKSNDPLHDLLVANPSSVSLLVEPVPWLFERLKANYANQPNAKFENAAIAEGSPGQKAFYYLSAAAKKALPELPPWFDQIGSFDRTHIFKHLGQEVEPYIISSVFPTLPFESLIQKHGIKRIDVLHIDAEGYDWEILSQVDLVLHPPMVILFEHVHLAPEIKERALVRLRGNYRILDLGCDYFCRRTK